MNLAERYERIRPTVRVREDEVVSSPPAMRELELQARWFAGDFGRRFVTTDGRCAEIVQFGIWNREAGPDFSNAAVVIDGGETQRGCIEIDMDMRDWEWHGHAENEAYDNVVLHLFVTAGEQRQFTRTVSNRLVPQVRIELAAHVGPQPEYQPLAKPGRCQAPLQNLPDGEAFELMEAAAQFRLRRKAARLLRMQELHGFDEALYQALAETLGYKGNKLPFHLIAQRLPLSLLRRNAKQLDALLFGVSGFLPSGNIAALHSETRDYVRQIWEGWWRQRAEFDRLVIGPKLWKLSGVRPLNHPQRRLAVLAQIVKGWSKLRRMAKARDLDAVRLWLSELEDEYWNFHYTLNSKRVSRQMALLGEERIIGMLANVFFPLIVHENPRRWESYRNLQTSGFNQRLEIAETRLFGLKGMPREWRRRVMTQQGLLQIYEDFCEQDDSDCARCPFPEQLANWRATLAEGDLPTGS